MHLFDLPHSHVYNRGGCVFACVCVCVCVRVCVCVSMPPGLPV